MPKNKSSRSGNPAKRNAKAGAVQSYALELDFEGKVIPPAYSLLAKVEDDAGFVHDYWVVMGLEHGFLGIPVGKESEADTSAVPGILWGSVRSIGSTQDPGELSVATLAYEQLSALWSGHEGIELGKPHQH